MYTTSHIDWLAITFPSPFQPEQLFPSDAAGQRWRYRGSGRYGYKDVMQSELGAMLMLNGSARQGQHLVCGGAVLEQLRAMSVTDTHLLEHMIALGGKASRLDVTLNVYDSTLTVADLAQAYHEGRIKTPARSGKRIQGINRSDDALYLGSRTSERYFRAYNKGAQMKVDDQAWLRLELELKNVRARAVASALTTVHNPERLIKSEIRGYCDMSDNETFKRAIEGEDIPMPKAEKPLRNTYAWLLDTVAPAMARYEREHPGEDVFSAFKVAYLYHLGGETLSKDETAVAQTFDN